MGVTVSWCCAPLPVTSSDIQEARSWLEDRDRRRCPHNSLSTCLHTVSVCMTLIFLTDWRWLGERRSLVPVLSVIKRWWQSKHSRKSPLSLIRSFIRALSTLKHTEADSASGCANVFLFFTSSWSDLKLCFSNFRPWELKRPTHWIICRIILDLQCFIKVKQGGRVTR